MNRVLLPFVVTLAVVLISFSICNAEEAVEPHQKIMLFDGRSFDDLYRYLRNNQGNIDETWKIKPRGILACAGKPAGYIRTVKAYKNYKLHFEYRWPARPGNNGALVHMVGEDRVWPKSLECQGGYRNQGEDYCAYDLMGNFGGIDQATLGKKQ